MEDCSYVGSLIITSERQTERKKTENAEKPDMDFLTHTFDLSINGEMICEVLCGYIW
jgi:hypothetical protein